MTTGSPLSCGYRSNSTDAKKASMSRWAIRRSLGTGELCIAAVPPAEARTFSAGFPPVSRSVRSREQHAAVNVLDVRPAAERHRQIQFVADDFQRALHAFLAH